MSESRRCGYCRESGHQKRACPLMSSTRDEIYAHTVKQRKEMHHILTSNGLGNGALIQRKDGNLFMVTGYGDAIPEWSFIDHKNVRYSKQVMLTKKTIEKGYYAPVTLKVMHLSSRGPVPDSLYTSVGALISEYSSRYAWDVGEYKVLEQSYEVDEIESHTWGKNIYIPRRLQNKKELAGPYATFDPFLYP